MTNDSMVREPRSVRADETPRIPAALIGLGSTATHMNGDQSPKQYGSVAEVREANKAAGQHWFEADTLRFFDGVVPEDQPIVHGRFFVSSEQFDSRSPRLHTVRYVNATAGIDTVGAFQQFESFDEARGALKHAVAAGVTISQVSGPVDADPSHYHWQVFIGDLPLDTAHTKADATKAAEEMARVVESETPPSNAGDYEPEEAQTTWECERIVLGETLRFEWSGGIYIEVSRPPGSPQEVINLSGNLSSGPRIERTQAEFEREVDEWIEQYPPEGLRLDVVENWDYRPQ
jgi:hypothetical protein